MQFTGALRVIVAVLVRPVLWATAVRQGVRLVPSHWWKTSPFLPVPAKDYIEFRAVTQYGGDHGSVSLDPHDVVDYLQWCREWNRSRS
ncbi:unannotated protein [freshwater metagenome]|uniref:Unannotated protein n=1 Tax=freshwater metagenome TaxID=449393 RepID=A0A6J6IBP9_9ZZZZ|nr:hypothetical protein [Actinomycetota bacterium]